MSRYLFDTNVFRAMTSQAQSGGKAIDHGIAECVKSKLKKSGQQLTGSTETMHELISHINAKESNSYEHFREALTSLIDYTDGQILEHADYALQTEIAGLPSHQSIVAPALELCKYLASASSFADLESFSKTVAISGGGILMNVSAHCVLVAREHTEFKISWAADHIVGMLGTYWSDYVAKRLQGKSTKLKGASKTSALNDLQTVQKTSKFAVALAVRAGLTEPIDQSVLDMIEDRLCAFMCAHYEIWRRAISNGYTFDANPNDMVDLLLLMHLIEDDIILVTQDDRLKNLIPQDCKQNSRVMTFVDLAKFLGC